MDFTFTSVRQPPLAPQQPPEPPDGHHGSNFTKESNMKVSFRDKVLGNQTFVARERVDLIANDMAKVELVQGNRLMPMLHVHQTIMEDLIVPWKDALVVKLLGKNLGYNIMKTKLEYVWKLVGGIELMDIGNAFYMVKFDGEDDKNKVINEGPWMIYDQYLAVRQWSPTFNASTAKIDKTMVWIRIPSLNLAFYDESVLWAVASMVGNPVKVDLHTLKVARGRFARMCAEVDITKPVVGRVGINGEWYQVQYEGLHIICTQCGCYGHLLKDCTPPKMKTNAEEEVNNDGAANGKAEPGPKPVEPGSKPVEPSIKSNESVMNAQEPLQIISVTEGALNATDSKLIADDICSPNSLHGNWITVEKKKRNNKSSNRGVNGLFKGGQLQPQHAKFGFLNKAGYINMQKEIQDEEIDPQITHNQRAEVRLKKKRLNQDTNYMAKTSLNKSTSDPVNNGVYDGGYNSKRSLDHPNKVHGKSNNVEQLTKQQAHITLNKSMKQANEECKLGPSNSVEKPSNIVQIEGEVDDMLTGDECVHESPKVNTCFSQGEGHDISKS